MKMIDSVVDVSLIVCGLRDVTPTRDMHDIDIANANAMTSTMVARPSAEAPPSRGNKVLWRPMNDAGSARRRPSNVFHQLHSALCFVGLLQTVEAVTFDRSTLRARILIYAPCKNYRRRHRSSLAAALGPSTFGAWRFYRTGKTLKITLDSHRSNIQRLRDLLHRPILCAR
jgi:hypothetical protein